MKPNDIAAGISGIAIAAFLVARALPGQGKARPETSRLFSATSAELGGQPLIFSPRRGAPAQSETVASAVTEAPRRNAAAIPGSATGIPCDKSPRPARISWPSTRPDRPASLTARTQGSPASPAASETAAPPAGYVDVVEEPSIPAALQAGRTQNFTPEEKAAVAHAQRIFSDGLAASPSSDPKSDTYFDYWQVSSDLSDEYLRAVLGWAKFNSLSSAARAAYQGPATSQTAR